MEDSTNCGGADVNVAFDSQKCLYFIKVVGAILHVELLANEFNVFVCEYGGVLVGPRRVVRSQIDEGSVGRALEQTMNGRLGH